MKKLSIPNYDSFDNPHVAYSDFINKHKSVINVVAPIKTVRIENSPSGLMEKLQVTFAHDICYTKNSDQQNCMLMRTYSNAVQN